MRLSAAHGWAFVLSFRKVRGIFTSTVLGGPLNGLGLQKALVLNDFSNSFDAEA